MLRISELPDIDINIKLQGSEIEDYFKNQIGNDVCTEWSEQDLKDYFFDIFKDFLTPDFINFEIKVEPVSKSKIIDFHTPYLLQGNNTQEVEDLIGEIPKEEILEKFRNNYRKEFLKKLTDYEVSYINTYYDTYINCMYRLVKDRARQDASYRLALKDLLILKNSIKGANSSKVEKKLNVIKGRLKKTKKLLKQSIDAKEKNEQGLNNLINFLEEKKEYEKVIHYLINTVKAKIRKKNKFATYTPPIKVQAILGKETLPNFKEQHILIQYLFKWEN